MRDEMLRCSQFVNDASMEVTLTGARITEFEQTFLCWHQLAILDYRETQSKVQEDQDFTASTPQIAAASELQKLSIQCSNELSNCSRYLQGRN